jgi:succinate-semialdehyde dehydrogenase / glutarate-semialdehyde dehydrogenase
LIHSFIPCTVDFSGGAVSVAEECLYSVNPATEEILGSYRLHSGGQIEGALGEAQKAFTTWRRETISVRAGFMRNAAIYLRQNKKRFATLMTLEMGKPIVE